MSANLHESQFDESVDRERLFEDNVALVKTIAQHISIRLPPGKSVDDLIQVGLIGLLEASRVYEPRLGVEFKSYASIRIRGAILDELRRETWVPRSVQQKSRKLSQAIQAVENREGRNASDQEIALELNLTMEEYGELLESVASSTVFSLDDDESFLEPSGEEDEVFDKIRFSQMKSRLADAIGQLPEQEKLVIVLYYDYGLNLREIGEVLNVSESRACQVHTQATSRLQIKMRDWKSENEDS